MKICNTCNIEKSYNEFRKRKGFENRYYHKCKSCDTEYNRQRRKILRPKVEEGIKNRIIERGKKNEEKYVGMEFGSFIITKYLGRSKRNGEKYEREFFEKKCKFCDNTTQVTPGEINNIINKGKCKCPFCKESFNVHNKTKKCFKCNVWKEANSTNFRNCKSRTFGLFYYCKDCSQNLSRKRRESKEVRRKEYLQKQERIKVDPLFKLTVRTRVLIKNYINRVKKTGFKKKSKTVDILGCNYVEFKSYIEKQFVDDMNWDNYGKWHLDHKIPVSLATNEDEVIELCHYTNYQPLWKSDNLSKNNKVFLDILTEDNKTRFDKYIKRYYDINNIVDMV